VKRSRTRLGFRVLAVAAATSIILAATGAWAQTGPTGPDPTGPDPTGPTGPGPDPTGPTGPGPDPTGPTGPGPDPTGPTGPDPTGPGPTGPTGPGGGTTNPTPPGSPTPPASPSPGTPPPPEGPDPGDPSGGGTSTDPGGQSSTAVYVPTGGDGWVGALLGFAVGEGGRLLVPGLADERSGGRSLHLRPQGAAASALAVTAALDSSALQPAGVSDGGSGGPRTFALLLVLVAGIALAVLAVREWRGGAGGRSLAESWQRVWDRRPGAGRSGT
jgi:hypothetical protein